MTEESVPMWQGVTALQLGREYIVRYQLKGHRRLRLMFADYLGRDQYADIYLFQNNNTGKVYTFYVDDIYSIEDFEAIQYEEPLPPPPGEYIRATRTPQEEPTVQAVPERPAKWLQRPIEEVVPEAACSACRCHELRKEYRQELNKINMAYTSGRRHLSAVVKAGHAEAKTKYYMKLMENGVLA